MPAARPDSDDDPRVTFAFFTAPAICAPVFVVVSFAALFIVDGASAFRDVLSLLIGSVIIVLPAAYAVEVFVGYPLYLALRASNRLNARYVIASGTIVGMLVATLFALATQSADFMVFVAGASGGAAAFVWWQIVAGPVDVPSEEGSTPVTS